MLEKFKERFGKYTDSVQFDQGKEFYNVGVQKVQHDFEGNDVELFLQQGDLRLDRRSGKLVENYNGTKHGSTLMKPVDVNESNKDAVWVTLYGSALGALPLPKFRVGDTVRASRYKSVFGKGYEANFTEEIFKVTRVLRGDPNVYELEDHEGEPIVGKFYEEELSTVEKRDETYRVEKVLRKKNGMALVKWLGYDSRSWVPLKDIKDVISS